MKGYIVVGVIVMVVSMIFVFIDLTDSAIHLLLFGYILINIPHLLT